MSFAQSILGMLARTESSPDTVPPGHWKREEDQYLTQIDAMHYIQLDPMARAGYEAMQNPDGSGLMMGGEPVVPLARGTYQSASPWEKWWNDARGEVNVTTELLPEYWGHTLAHELGHAGAYATGNNGPGEDEEIRQRMTDYFLYPRGSTRSIEGLAYLNWEKGIDPRNLGPSGVSRWLPYVDPAAEWGVQYVNNAQKSDLPRTGIKASMLP